MCDEGKDRFGAGGAENFLAEKGAAGQISLKNTELKKLSNIWPRWDSKTTIQ